MTVNITLYTKEKCGLCTEAKELLEEISKEYNIQINEIDIYSDDELLEEYQLMIPVIDVERERVGFGKISKLDIISVINGHLNY
ncbi:glutaredoxin family protein [Bacillus sp. RG28]|uniref:Glutaredoxin family protein n=1 Tax=Gottfriedia endophytica TaxID=2820819 RepID=A0A940SL72_9BACI|nr:glutaredoxin family protein [Gottfriedia endophytica]MBP0726799.1 glutaredoxin family protein [Gottfriedia endophytica]